MLPTLSTARLILRPLIAEDAPSIFEYAKNPKVSDFTMWEPHQTEADSKSFITDYALKFYEEGTPEPYGIILKADPAKVIGTVGCFWVSKYSQVMELAYAIAEPHWGKGLVPEASGALLEYCFHNLPVQRIQARCKAENKSSVRVMEKLGMSFEGTLKSLVLHRDRFWDVHYYARVRPRV